jgi:hypothetical protein
LKSLRFSSRYSADIVLCVAVFVTATVVGSLYVRAFDRMGSRTPPNLQTMPSRSMWYGQADFGAAVALACGRGYVDPGVDPPSLMRFLSLQSDAFSCADLPASLPSRPLRITQRLYPYLLSATAAIWAVRGVSWTALWPLFGLLYGVSTAICYGLFRLGMGRRLSVTLSTALMISPIQLGNLPGLRDYAKVPFLLGLILIAAAMVRHLEQRRALLILSLLFGVTLGIGFGFRNDLLVVIPLMVVALLVWDPPRSWRAVGLRATAMVVAVMAFIAVAFPILSGYQRGSNTGHVALLGFVSPFDQPLGVIPSVYQWSYLYSDGYTDATVQSYSNRVHNRQVAYLSPEYDRAAVEYVARIARLWPADILTRAYASVLRIGDIPFNPGMHAEAVPYGISDGMWQKFYRVHNRVVDLLHGKGLLLIVLALAIISGTNAWWAALLLLDFFYLAGYPAIQFQPRHYFYLEFIPWWALGFVVHKTLLTLPIATRRNPAAWLTPGIEARRAILFVLIASTIVIVVLIAARIYQQRSMLQLLRSYTDAERDRLPTESRQLADGRTLMRTTTLWRDRLPGNEVNTQYIVVRFAPASCPVVRLPVTFRYATTGGEDFSLDTVVTFLPQQPADLFFPAYRIEGKSEFEGIEVGNGFEGCVAQIGRVRDPSRFPMLMVLRLTPGWDQQPLYQRFAGWEGDDSRKTFPALYALPADQTLTVATVYSQPGTPSLLWRTPIVHDDGAAAWRIKGTPQSPVWPLFEVAPESRTSRDQFVIQGEVITGGVTVGLVRSHAWTSAGNISITDRGPFIAVLAPTETGEYGVLVENGLHQSWLLRNAPSVLIRLIARSYDFNDVRIGKAGWISRGND